MSRWTSWRPTQDRAQLQVVWDEHKRLGLEEDLAFAIKKLGGATPRTVEIIAIRETNDVQTA